MKYRKNKIVVLREIVSVDDVDACRCELYPLILAH